MLVPEDSVTTRKSNSKANKEIVPNKVTFYITVFSCLVFRLLILSRPLIIKSLLYQQLWEVFSQDNAARH